MGFPMDEHNDTYEAVLHPDQIKSYLDQASRFNK